MSEARQPPKNVWWYCHACGASNGPRDTTFCNHCGRNKQDAMDAERWEKFLTADAVLVSDDVPDATD